MGVMGSMVEEASCTADGSPAEGKEEFEHLMVPEIS